MLILAQCIVLDRTCSALSTYYKSYQIHLPTTKDLFSKTFSASDLGPCSPWHSKLTVHLNLYNNNANDLLHSYSQSHYHLVFYHEQTFKTDTLLGCFFQFLSFSVSLVHTQYSPSCRCKMKNQCQVQLEVFLQVHLLLLLLVLIQRHVRLLFNSSSG